MTNEVKVVREKLARIVGIMNEDKTEWGANGADFWSLYAILAALRGPDMDQYGAGARLKRRTTVVIRFAMFPDTTWHRYYLDTRDGFTPGKIRLSREEASTHFGGHVLEAARSLGLEIEYVQVDEDGYIVKTEDSSPDAEA